MRSQATGRKDMDEKELFARRLRRWRHDAREVRRLLDEQAKRIEEILR